VADDHMKDSDLYIEAAAFRAAFGDRWLAEAAMHNAALTRRSDVAALQRLSRLLEIMREMDAPKH
jgi:hypothetical protein